MDSDQLAALPEPRAVAALVAPTLTGLGYETWNFGDSVGFEALIASSDLLGDERWATFGWGWARAWASRAKPFVRQDCTAPGLAIIELAHQFDDAVLLGAAVELAEYLMTRPPLHGVYQTSVHAPLQQPCGPARLDAAGAEGTVAGAGEDHRPHVVVVVELVGDLVHPAVHRAGHRVQLPGPVQQ
ncbi:MAG: hypothetical protein M3Y77_15585, partial [Actinomycetota bacterium]|nr:hypothetical protein [Actinomycetota bacterium]